LSKKGNSNQKDAGDNTTASITLDEKKIECSYTSKDGKTIKGTVVIRAAMRKNEGTKYLYLGTGRRHFFINEENIEPIMNAIQDLDWESDDVEPVDDATETDDKVLNAIEKLTAHIAQLGKNQSKITQRLKKLES